MHKPILSDKAVGGCDDVKRLWVKDGCRDFKVDKARMVHKVKGRLALSDFLHSDFLVFEFCGNKVGRGNNTHKRAPKYIRANRLAVRLFVPFGKLRQRAVIGFGKFNFHKNNPRNGNY